MNIAKTSPAELDKELRRLEREHAEARAAAEKQRQADAEEAARLAEIEAQRLAAERAAQQQREALFAAEAEAAAAVEALRRNIEELRLSALRDKAEQSDAGLTLLDRARDERDRFGTIGDIRDASDAELAVQSSRLMRQLTGVETDPELWQVLEPGRMAECQMFGHLWFTAFVPNEPGALYVADRNKAPQMVRGLSTLATLADEGSLPGLVAAISNKETS